MNQPDNGTPEPAEGSDSAEVQVRVRYPECDPAGMAHHSVFPVWLEMARTELLRRRGPSYVDLTARGVLFVVARLNVRYRRPVRYDDVLNVRAAVAAVGRARIDHAYEIRRWGELIATAETTLACVDGQGRPQAIPDMLTR